MRTAVLFSNVKLDHPGFVLDALWYVKTLKVSARQLHRQRSNFWVPVTTLFFHSLCVVRLFKEATERPIPGRCLSTVSLHIRKNRHANCRLWSIVRRRYACNPRPQIFPDRRRSRRPTVTMHTV